jgi:hypothetical protein
VLLELPPPLFQGPAAVAKLPATSGPRRRLERVPVHRNFAPAEWKHRADRWEALSLTRLAVVYGVAGSLQPAVYSHKASTR